MCCPGKRRASNRSGCSLSSATLGGRDCCELCRRFGISRKTGYKLIGPYGERSARPEPLITTPTPHPHRWPVASLTKRERPTWGQEGRRWLRSVERRALAIPQHGERHGPCGSGEASQAAALERTLPTPSTPTTCGPLTSRAVPHRRWDAHDPLKDAMSRYLLVCRSGSPHRT